ncbi:MAG: family 10 glycosylhydrolase [Lewinella sp.]|nr:family 10 glycosylhydrolase [Lewinella sp.]
MLSLGQAGSVDYLAPQIYWNIGHPAADYAGLLSWWTKNTPSGLPLYIGHAAYKVGSDPQPAWNDLEELPRQINLNRRNGRPVGSIFFSTRSLLGNPAGLSERMKDFYAGLYLVPEQTGAPGSPPPAPHS